MEKIAQTHRGDGVSIREKETTQITEALLSGQSLLVLGEPGSGKSALAENVRSLVSRQGYSVAISSYAGAQKESLLSICDQLGVSTIYDDGSGGKPKNKTAQQLKDSLLEELQKPGRLLICDDGQRWSAALRYWLEDCWRAKTLLLVLAWEPSPRDIFTKLPVIKLAPLTDGEVREIMRTEAANQGVKLSVSDLAKLQTSAGNNPAIARRLIQEAALGITDQTKSAAHYQYIDGTPMLIIMLIGLGMVRFVGLGMGDKAIYLIGGLITLGTLALRVVLYSANRGGRKL